MNLLSFDFLLFILVLTVLYFRVPKRLQWVVLLVGSLFFYAFSGPRNLIFLALTACSTWLAARHIEAGFAEQKSYLSAHKGELDREQKKAVRKKYAARRRRVLILGLVFNFGMLSVFKYLHFLVEQLNVLLGAFHGGAIPDAWTLIAPLGISFYTFQTMGYLIDVYWQKVPAEQNPAKMLLFTSFFPQVTQGPISDFAELTGELFTPHDYSYHNFSWGAMRMLWGFFKKMALANALNVYVQDLYVNYGVSYTGVAAFLGMVMYSIQIYADFSGYMDIVCGYCEILGIRLTENFERPYFSKSIAEYWRRWHISLGRWFKTYLYYPIAVARWNQKLGQRAQDRFGKAFGRALPASVALVAVWFTTGLWHGASWAYILWGGLNGLIIIFSLWMEPVYETWKQRLHVNESSFLWRAFQVGRTFLILTFIKILPEVGTLGQGLGLWGRVFTEHTIPTHFFQLVPLAHENYVLFFAVCLGSLLLLCVSLLQRRQPVRQWLTEHTPWLFRVFLFVLLLLFTIYIGFPLMEQGGGFMYAQF